MPGTSSHRESPSGMSCLLYLSQACDPFTDSELATLELQAASANQQLMVTGYLFYANDRFVQYIEGPADTLAELYERIRNDSRHTILHVIHGAHGSQRRFPHWSMRRVNRRTMFGLEELLAQHMSWVNQSPAADDISDDLAWSMVDRMAELQAQL